MIPAIAAAAHPGAAFLSRTTRSPFVSVRFGSIQPDPGPLPWEQARHAQHVSTRLAAGLHGRGVLGSPSARQAAVPLPAPDLVAPPAGPTVTSRSADWYAIAACESGGNWATNTGNGYWGGLQFAPSTWYAYGGGSFSGSGPFPYSASAQIAVAERVLAAQGPGAWPNCFRWG